MGEYSDREYYKTEIIRILDGVESIKVLEYFYNFIKIAVTRWK